MTNKELKRLSRADLLELLIGQEKEIRQLRAQLQEANEKLESRRITMEEAGSIAEASLQLNGVFSAAEAAAAQYLDNVKGLRERQQSICEKMKADCEAECAQLLEQTKAYCQHERQAAENYWKSISQKLQTFYDEHEGLEQMITEITYET